MIRVETEGPVAVVVIDNPPVNAASAGVRRGLLDAFRALPGGRRVEAAVLIGAGGFVSGSDVREFGGPLPEPGLPEVIAAIEDCPCPVVGALGGTALGGGLELALGCDVRIAGSTAVVGLPEVGLGMIPGAGGTVRLPRLTGPVRAMELIGSGARIGAGRALELGIVDEVVPDDDLRTAAVSLARGLGGKRRVRELSVPRADPAEIDAVEAAVIRKGRGRPQVREAMAAVRRAGAIPFDGALAAEREVFQRLRSGPEAAALRHLFFAERRAAKVDDCAEVAPRNITSAAVIGGGAMGAGIAACLAEAGIATTVVEPDEAVARRARDALPGVTVTGDPAGIAGADIAIEAVFEDMPLKKDVLRQCDALLRPGAVIASNTSYLDLDELAAATTRPADVVGMHFFNPARRTRLLEVVRGERTSPEVLRTVLGLGRRIGKVPVVARVAEGFIGNRIFAAYRRQCEFMLEEGALPEQVDAAIEASGFAMGPFAVADLSGLDIAWRMRRRLDATRDERERYVDIPDRLHDLGRLGRKTGAGYYRYDENARRGTPDPAVRALIEHASAEKGITRRTLSAAEISARAMVTIVNEALHVVSEGIAQRPSDVDVVLVHGYGFPKFTGGPLHWAAGPGRAELLDGMHMVEHATGYGFHRADLGLLAD